MRLTHDGHVACGPVRISISEIMLLLMQFARLFGFRSEPATDRDGTVSAMTSWDHMPVQTVRLALRGARS
jgi:hypothetical protein